MVAMVRFVTKNAEGKGWPSDPVGAECSTGLAWVLFQVGVSTAFLVFRGGFLPGRSPQEQSPKEPLAWIDSLAITLIWFDWV